MYIKTLSVTKLNNYIKKLMDNDFILKNICVKGEISNFKLHSSGHMYFSLKDIGGKINCIMFRSDAENLKFLPENGMQIVATGRVSLYIKDGVYQLYCSDMQLDGIGQLYIEFDRLKQKLMLQGLFNEDHKKKLPIFPKKVGVITSATGAAIRDIINVTKRRNNIVSLIIYPSLVQGNNSSRNLIQGINYFDNREDIDVIILSRGGGSIEELWEFNNEQLAYSIYNCKTPVVTGVGHETDFTIADFVSDKRAPTPSAAAEITIPKLDLLKNEVNILRNTLEINMEKLLSIKNNNLDSINKHLKLNNPINKIVNEYKTLDNLAILLNSKIKFKINLETEKLNNLYKVMESNNPLNILKKGYSVIQTEEGCIINNLDELKKNNKVDITLREGKGKFKIEFLEEL